MSDGDGRVLLSQADIGEVEERYVLDALRSGWVAPLGPHVDAFEAEVAERVGVRHALALSSGTAALHLALEGVDPGPGSCVVLPTMTFAASANAVLYTGAEPVFVDAGADADVDPDLLLHAVDTLRGEGRRVAAVLTVDLYGRACDYARIVPGLQERGVVLIEDAAEALGARRDGRAAGSFGRAAALSFNGNKIMTTSGGGMLLSDDTDLVDRARYLSTQARMPVPWYEHTEMGYNYRLSNVLAALGRAQLTRLDDMIARRRAHRDAYEEAVAGLEGVRVLGRGDDTDEGDNCWLTSLVLDPAHFDRTADEIVTRLGAMDIEARHLWKPMHMQPLFEGARSFLDGTSERLFAQGLNLPSGSSLSDGQIARVCEAVRTVLDEAHR